MSNTIKAIVALAGIGFFSLVAVVVNRALESYVVEAVAQEAERQDVSRAKEVEQLRKSQESATQSLAGIEDLLRRDTDREERTYCLEYAYPDSTSPARLRACDAESDLRWLEWARQDSVRTGLLPPPEEEG